MLVLVTGAAGFIGSYVSTALLNLGHTVIGVDIINDYYDIRLKHERLRLLEENAGFNFYKIDIANHEALKQIPNINDVDVVIHLAAQAGVRYSIENPFAYAQSNLLGHLSILELVRHHNKKPFLLYASSSSVYGNSSVAPFSENELVNNPVSLYAATKIADELMSKTYANMYGIKQVGLRFFTVYGPMGRPDMAYWTFSDKILKNEAIPVFNNGDLRRDFTYIDDIVEGIVRIAQSPPNFKDGETPHKVYNIGNSNPVQLKYFISTLEDVLGKKAIIDYKPMQLGDVYETSADVTLLNNDYGFKPNTELQIGLNKFAIWYKDWLSQIG